MKALRQSWWLGISLMLMASQAVAGTLSLTDLGTLGGSTSTGTAINDNGYAVGSSLTAGGANHAFEYNPTTQTMTDLGVVAGQTSSVAYAIDDSLVVGGQSGNLAFTSTAGGLTSLGPGAILGLNDSGTAIGEVPKGSAKNTSEWDASNNQAVYFSTLNTQGFSINDSGHFVGVQTTNAGQNGYYATGASDSSYADNLGTFLPAYINSSNIIAGQESSDHEAAIFTVSTLTETVLGKLSPSDSSSTASGINSSGTVVGTSGSAGFEWTSSGGMVSLTSLLGSQYSGWTIVSASAINDNGQILAEGLRDGVEHAVVLTATPEPSSFVLIGIAAAGLAFAALKRRGSASRGAA